MKKTLSVHSAWRPLLLLPLIFILSLTMFYATGVSDFVAACDVSGDGRVNSSDARVLLRVSAKLQTLEPSEAAQTLQIRLFGDMNGDAHVNSMDARLVLRYAAKLAGESDFHIVRLTQNPDETGGELVENSTSPVFDPDTLPKNTLLTPDTDHGLGRAQMIVTSAEYALMTPKDQSNMRYTPLLNPYIRGTTDYVTETRTIEGLKVYVLASGERIEADDARFLSAGYVLPSNTLSVEGVTDSESETAIWLKPLWQSPVLVSFEPQEYYSGYENRPYNLSEFTAEYMELTFCHTTALTGDLTFPEDSIFRSASWETSSGNTVLRLYLREKGVFYGYSIEMTDSGYLRISAKNGRPGIAGKTIVLDAGHGGDDPGGGYNGVYEDGINLKTVQYLKTMLEDAGATVVMTRTDDTAVTLNERVAITRRNDADLFLSVHCDVAPSSPSAAGVSVYYYYPFSMPYADDLQDGLVQAYREKIYSSSEKNYGIVDRDIKFYPFQVARVESCPAVLIELGFLTNDRERAVLQTESAQRALAEGIFSGISVFFGA